jgi:hypothetical protein
MSRTMPSDWFVDAFGFQEGLYEDTKKKFNEMFALGDYTSLNGIHVGTFRVIPNITYDQTFPYFTQNGKVTLKNIAGDIKTITNQKITDRATIQVASQFNCLEMINPCVTPEYGITRYQDDKTQGPICAMSAPAGLAYRNYLYRGGQTQTNQIDMVSDLLKYLKTFDDTITWTNQNGYLLFDNDEQLIKINKILLQSPYIRKIARGYIMSGSHKNQGVFSNSKETHLINHVYCSGLPISYNFNIKNINLWDGLSELFLEAMYENTLLEACMNNIESSLNKPCYLTKIGTGAFGMKDSHVIRAIQRACNIVANKGLFLDVIVVHYINIDEQYNIPLNYPLTNSLNVNSVWDDIKWISQNV